MKQEFLDIFEKWMSDNQISFVWDDKDCINIPEFGKMYVFDTESCDGILIPKKNKKPIEMVLNMPIPIGELIDDDIFYTAIKFGDCFYYIDLREEIKLNILKYIGKTSMKSDYEYVNLGIHSSYELMNGSFLFQDWINKAKFFGHKTIGICDFNTLGGTFPLQKACDAADMKFVFGYSLIVNIKDDDADISFGGKIYCLTDEGWANMLRIQKFIMVDNSEDPHITLDELAIRGNGNCFVFDKLSSAELTDDLVDFMYDHFDQVYYQFDISEFKANRFDEKALFAAKEYIDKWYDKIDPVLICDNYYLDKADAGVKKLVNKIDKKTKQQSEDQYYKHISEHLDSIRPLFDDIISEENGEEWYCEFLKEITENTFKIANAANFRIKTGVLYAPEYEQSKEEFKKYKGDNHSLFLDKIEKGFKELVPEGKEDEYRKRLDKEIYVIESTNNVDYFLVTSTDCVHSGRDNNIQMGIGRGSAGGCLISYLLKIITVDPLSYDLLFERFLTNERCGLVKQDATIVGDDVEIDDKSEVVHIELDDGKSIEILPDSELIVSRDGQKINVFGNELIAGDDILFDRRDELYEIKEVEV